MFNNGLTSLTSMPQIPEGLLHTMYDIISDGKIDQDAGGQWKKKKSKQVSFSGVVLPVSDKDLMREPQGTFTKLSEKIYTNGYALKVGGSVFDPQTGGRDRGIIYTITQELGHNSIHPLKRYVVEKKAVSSPK